MPASTSARRSGRAAPLPPEERRQAIVQAVVPLLIEHGASVPTRLIAQAAGVAEGTIFRVFPDKHALLMAAAEETLNPSDARESLTAVVAGVDDLHEVVRRVTERMFVRSERVMAVLLALREIWTEPGKGPHPRGRAAHAQGRHEPPGFVVASHQALLARLTEVFEPFRAELTVTPERAALLLRTLVLGSRHPGMQAEDRLTVDEVTEVLLHGIHREGRS